MRLQWIFGLAISALTTISVQAECIGSETNPYLCETNEIRFSGEKFGEVGNKAKELGSLPKIYEYLRNESRFKHYFGVKSNSLNTLEGLSGNDIDLASTLIAMLRSQGIKSRYAVGPIKVNRHTAANWLGVQDGEQEVGLAKTLLLNMGMNDVSETGTDVLFEHVWVEVLVDYSHYRGINDVLTPCVLETDNRCSWIALDPSFKSYTVNNEHNDKLAGLTFNYPAYYAAEAPTSESYISGLKNKNPLEIYEESALEYLRDNNPGITTKDVENIGDVVADSTGLLPSTLPYTIDTSDSTSVRNYASVSDHDNAENERDWSRSLRAKVRPIHNGKECSNSYSLPTYNLATLSSSRYSLNMNESNQLVAGLGDVDTVVLDGNSALCGEETLGFGNDSIFNLELELDGALPEDSETPEEESKVRAVYSALIASGSYMISTGGEESNWGQVQRAYDELLASLEQFPLVTEAGKIYVDSNGNGYDGSDLLYADAADAQKALTGGLLYAAQRLYYTRLQEQQEQYQSLKNITYLMNGRIGLVSAKSAINTLEETPFSITPEGLLIDLKANVYIGNGWNNASGEGAGNENFNFIGHLSSSLEHEVWQELTGFDAISTVRGLQWTEKDGDEIVTFDSTDGFESILFGPYGSWNFGFSSNPYQYEVTSTRLFNDYYVSYDYTGVGEEPGFEALIPTAEGVPEGDIFSKAFEYGAAQRELMDEFVEVDNDLAPYKDAELANSSIGEYALFNVPRPEGEGYTATLHEAVPVIQRQDGFFFDNGITNQHIPSYDQNSSQTVTIKIAKDSFPDEEGFYDIPFYLRFGSIEINRTETYTTDLSYYVSRYGNHIPSFIEATDNGFIFENLTDLGDNVYSFQIRETESHAPIEVWNGADPYYDHYKQRLVFPYEFYPYDKDEPHQDSSEDLYYDEHPADVHIRDNLYRERYLYRATATLQFGDETISIKREFNFLPEPVLAMVRIASGQPTIDFSLPLCDLDLNGRAFNIYYMVSDCFDEGYGAYYSKLEKNFSEGMIEENYHYRSKGSWAYQNRYSLETLVNIQNNFFNELEPGERWEYIMPESPRTDLGGNYDFELYIANKYEGITAEDPVGELTRQIFGIANDSGTAGGGYVAGNTISTPATDTEGVTGYGATLDVSNASNNNATNTQKNLISAVNNDRTIALASDDPVATVTGNMYHDETDIHIPGLGLDYLVTRTYNSNPTTSSGPGSANPNYLPLSQGWTHSYNMKLVANDYGEFPDYSSDLSPENENGLTSSITYVNERGGEVAFLLDDGDSNAQPTSGHLNFDTLTLDSPVAGKHTLEFQNGTKYIFDAQTADMRLTPESSAPLPQSVARLSQIVNPYGQILNLNYTDGQLKSVRDSLNIPGRTGLAFFYHAEGHASEGRLYSVVDWTGRVLRRFYYTDNNLSWAQSLYGEGIRYTYVPGTHLLADIIKPEDRNGKKVTTTFSYYSNDKAYNYVDQLGGAESLTYDPFRKRTKITHPDGQATEHFYNNKGALVKMTQPDGGILTFDNNEDGLRYLKRNALGYETTYSYNTDGSLDGAATNTAGKVTKEQDALNNTIDYTYGLYGQITQVTDKRGIVAQSEYYQTTDAAMGAVKGKLQKIKMPAVTVNGTGYTDVTLVEMTYFPDGTPKQSIQYIDPADLTKQRITEFDYNYTSTGFTLTKTVRGATSGVNATIVSSFDSLWRLTDQTVTRRTSATDANMLSLTTSYEYDDLSRVTATVFPNGDRLEAIYDKNGKVTHITNRYAINGGDSVTGLHPECFIDEENYPEHHSCIVQTRVYDEVDRLKSVTNIENNTTYYTRDSMGRVTQVEDANNNKANYEYGAKGRLTAVTDQNGHRVETQYDLAGQVKRVTNANGKSTHFEYDALGRLTKLTSPGGKQTHFTEYDGNGNLLKVKDANAVAEAKRIEDEVSTDPNDYLNAQDASVYKEFDEFNRVTKTLNANDEQTLYRYDLLGNLTGITDAKGQVTTFIYDDMGRLQYAKDPMVEEPADKVESYTYDEVGNVLTYTDRKGDITRYTYDQLNRLTLVEYLTDGGSQTYQYDQYGDTVSIGNAQVVYTYTYDNQHRLLSKTDSRNNRSLSWTYDKVGNVKTKTDYQGDETYYTYDSANRLTAMRNEAYLAASYQYDGNGTLLSRTLSNGASTQYKYSDDGFLLEMTQRSADGSEVDKRVYTPDNIGNIDQVIINDSETISYSYDPAYRLLNADSTDNSHDFVYTYDKVGNRLTKAFNGVTHHYLYNNSGNRLDQVRLGSPTGPLVSRYDYDDNGSRIASYNSADVLVQQYIYNQQRLVTDIAVSAANNQFAYDANSYRIAKNTPNKNNNYLLEGEHLEAIYNDDGERQSSYLRGAVIDEIINGFERKEGKLVNQNYHNDQVNSLVATSDHNGATIQTLSYGPFGEALSANDGNENNFNYTGRELDAESGLYYYRARYYDPEIGRFISEDPIGFASGDVNFYAYVGNSPLVYTDPLGFARLNLSKYPKEVQERILAHLKRGRISEGRVLDDLGLDKNTLIKHVDDFDKGTIPDALTSTALYEIKDTLSVYMSDQLRIQLKYAKKEGLIPFLITGKNTHVSKEVLRDFQVIRRNDLGPSLSKSFLQASAAAFGLISTAADAADYAASYLTHVGSVGEGSALYGPGSSNPDERDFPIYPSSSYSNEISNRIIFGKP